MNSKHREFGTIVSAEESHWRGEGGPPDTVWVYLKFGSSGQGFGGLMLSSAESRTAFIEKLCYAFNVSSLGRSATRFGPFLIGVDQSRG